MSQMISNVYQPSGNKYDYIADLENTEISWSPQEKSALESHNEDITYPGRYCNTVVFGGVEIEVTSILNLNINNTTFLKKIGSTVKGYEDYYVDLARPLQHQYNLATKFYTNTEFGQSVGETVPAKLMISDTVSGTEIKWYDNNVLVNTDLLTHHIDYFAIAVAVSGTTIQRYAYIFMVGNSIWTSGSRNDSYVLSILNDGGYAGGGDTSRYGWSDDNYGDFALSKIFNINGNDADSGQVSDSGSITDANNSLDALNEAYGGYLGTDIVEYITGMDNAEAWNYLTTDPTSDGLSMDLPSTDGKEYKIIWEYANGAFRVYDGETYKDTLQVFYKQSGSHVYLTWFRQSQDVESATKFPFVYLIQTSLGNAQYMMYTVAGLDDSLNLEEFDNATAFWNEIDGYDPESGQDDDPQTDPDNVEDPAYDPLASGFLYAFMVDKTDMENLMEALTPESFAEKIRVDFGNNLYDFIVSYHMMPCLTNADSLNKVAISYRGNAFTYGGGNNLSLAPISKSWYKVDCGTKICLPKTTSDKPLRWDGFENWSSAQIQLYLPFIGYVHLNTADVWGKSIHIVYTFDILQGTCSVNIGIGSQGTIYTFNGSCIYKIPFTSTIDKSNQEIISGVMSSLGTAISIGSVAGGNLAGIGGALASGSDAAGHFISAMEHKAMINRGGNLTGTPGWNAPRNPALIITVPDLISGNGTTPAQTYNNINGYPTYVESTLDNYYNNYVEVGQIDLVSQPNSDGAVPNDSELEMIRSLVKDGVYV